MLTRRTTYGGYNTIASIFAIYSKQAEKLYTVFRLHASKTVLHITENVHYKMQILWYTSYWSFVRKTLLGPRPKPHLKLACNPVDYL